MLVDLLGRRFGRLLVVGRAPNAVSRKARWRVRCACGQERIVKGAHLRSGRTRSCGCLNVELSAARLHADPRCDTTTHGLAHTAEYRILKGARARCTNPADVRFPRYGGRGIEYRFPADLGEATVLLIETLGPRPEGLTLDRIDNDGHYEPGNLRWATRSEQQRNRRTKAAVR
jgi:hypothetical protein